MKTPRLLALTAFTLIAAASARLKPSGTGST